MGTWLLSFIDFELLQKLQILVDWEGDEKVYLVKETSFPIVGMKWRF